MFYWSFILQNATCLGFDFVYESTNGDDDLCYIHTNATLFKQIINGTRGEGSNQHIRVRCVNDTTTTSAMTSTSTTMMPSTSTSGPSKLYEAKLYFSRVRRNYGMHGKVRNSTFRFSRWWIVIMKFWVVVWIGMDFQEFCEYFFWRWLTFVCQYIFHAI